MPQDNLLYAFSYKKFTTIKSLQYFVMQSVICNRIYILTQKLFINFTNNYKEMASRSRNTENVFHCKMYNTM